MSLRKQRVRAMQQAMARRGSDPVHAIPTGDRVRTGAIAAPRNVLVTDRRVTAGRKESPITEFAQGRHEFAGEYVRRTPEKVRAVTNGSNNHVRIVQMPKGTKPLWK